MRLLHIINDLRIGGAEMLLTDLAIALQKSDAGIDVEIYALARSNSFLEQRLCDAEIPLHFAPDKLSLRSPKQITPLREQVAGFDLIHSHLFPAQLWTAAAASRLPQSKTVRLLTSEQNTWNRRRKAATRFLYHPLDRWMYSHYETIIATSEPIRSSLVEWQPQTDKKTVVIHNGVHLERFAGYAGTRLSEYSATQDAGYLATQVAEHSDTQVAEILHTRKSELLKTDLPNNAPLLLCVGRLEPQKDQATLLRAMPKLPNVHTALVGVGIEENDLRRLANKLNIADRVHFLGQRSDIPDLLAASDLYIQPSKWEGFGIAVVEAMAAGCPVIVSDVPGVRDVVADAGLLFTAEDSEKLAQRIEKLLNDAELRHRLSSLGRERAKLYSMQRCLDEHLQLYINPSSAN